MDLVFERLYADQTMLNVCHYERGIGLRYVVQLGMNAWNTYTQEPRLKSVEIVLQSSMLHNNGTVNFVGTDNREKRYAPLFLRTCNAGTRWVVVPGKAGDGKVA